MHLFSTAYKSCQESILYTMFPKHLTEKVSKVHQCQIPTSSAVSFDSELFKKNDQSVFEVWQSCYQQRLTSKPPTEPFLLVIYAKRKQQEAQKLSWLITQA